jgi:hypothetical protein
VEAVKETITHNHLVEAVKETITHNHLVEAVETITHNNLVEAVKETVTIKSLKLVELPSQLALPVPRIQVVAATIMGELWLLAVRQSNLVKWLPSMASRFRSLLAAEILSLEAVR